MNTIPLNRIAFACLVASIGFALVASVVHAQATSPSPYVVSSSTPNSEHVEMNLPDNYAGEVSISCTNGKCETNSTSSPLNSAALTKIQTQMREQQEEMDRFFAQQQKFFQEQEQMFQNMFVMPW